jgi:hypothetical protein
LYDAGSNFLYAPSRSERVVASQMSQEQEVIEDEVNVDTE